MAEGGLSSRLFFRLWVNSEVRILASSVITCSFQGSGFAEAGLT